MLLDGSNLWIPTSPSRLRQSVLIPRHRVLVVRQGLIIHRILPQYSYPFSVQYDLIEVYTTFLLLNEPYTQADGSFKERESTRCLVYETINKNDGAVGCTEAESSFKILYSKTNFDSETILLSEAGPDGQCFSCEHQWPPRGSTILNPKYYNFFIFA